MYPNIEMEKPKWSDLLILYLNLNSSDATIISNMTTTPEIKPNISELSQTPKESGEVLKETQPVVEQNIQPSPGPFTVEPSVTTQPQTQPSDDSGVITITVPATPQQLEDWAKGSTDNSLTWFAFFWIRMIKKALAHGYRVLTTAAQPALGLF